MNFVKATKHDPFTERRYVHPLACLERLRRRENRRCLSINDDCRSCTTHARSTSLWQFSAQLSRSQLNLRRWRKWCENWDVAVAKEKVMITKWLKTHTELFRRWHFVDIVRPVTTATIPSLGSDKAGLAWEIAANWRPATRVVTVVRSADQPETISHTASHVRYYVVVHYSGDWNIRQCFYAIWHLGHPWPLDKNLTQIVPGEPLRRGEG